MTLEEDCCVTSKTGLAVLKQASGNVVVNLLKLVVN